MNNQERFKEYILSRYIDFVKLLLILILTSFCINNLRSQNNLLIVNKNEEIISWIDQFPSSEKTEKKKGIKGKVINFVFGKDKNTISKPFNVLAKNPESYWILDQGTGKINQVLKNSIENHKFLNKALSAFTSLVGICTLDENKILFTDSHLPHIYQVDLKKKKVISINDSLSLNRPTGIAYSKLKKEIWVVETGANRILVLNYKGEVKKIIGKRGSGQGEFNYPTFIWIDKEGSVYIVDAMNFRIQIFNKNGEFVSMFGKNGDATGYFARPKGIATDSFGNIYIPDALFHVVQIFDKMGNFLYAFGEQGKEKGQFWMPTGIFIDDENYIYVADSYNSRIQIFKLVNGESKNKK